MINVTIDYSKVDFNGHIKLAQKMQADYMIIFGEKEFESKQVSIKNLLNRHQDKVPFDGLTNYFQTILGDDHV